MTAPRLGPGGGIAGKYTVKAVLGDSGAVITYQCVSPQGQDVAVKLYDPAVAGHPPVMKALEQAYAATNALPQNASAPIMDAGYDPPTVAPFSVTELLRLPSLQAMQRRFTPEEVVTILKGMARSLDLAHLRQVVHGALKPTNVFLGPSANPLIVTDFAANLPKAAVPTAEGYTLSAPWIAPEQAQSGQVTAAADVFSAGLVAFYALTGRSYWRSCQGPTLDLAGWQQELSGPRTPASARAAEMGVALSPSVDAVLFKALSPDPNERYRSVGELASVLEEALAAAQKKQPAGGGAATMALPLVGDAPSPLPANLQKPPPAAGRPMSPQAPFGGGLPVMHEQEPTGAATMALPLSALMPGGLPPTAGLPGAPPGISVGQGASLQPTGPASSPPTQAFNMAQFDPRMSAGQNNAYSPGGAFPGPVGAPPGQPSMNGQPQYGQQQPAYGQQQPWGPPAGQPPGGSQAYGDPGYPPPPVAGMPSPPPIGANRPTGKSKVVPIAIGATAVVLLVAVATIVVWKVKSSPTTADTAQASAATTPAPKKDDAPPPAKDTAVAATTSTGAPSAAPVASSSAAPPDADVEVKLACSPSCDAIVVDGKAVSASDPMKLKPGNHTVQASKSGYVPQQVTLAVKAGEPVDKTFTLVEAPKQPVGPVRPNPPCKKNGFVCPCGAGKCSS